MLKGKRGVDCLGDLKPGGEIGADSDVELVGAGVGYLHADEPNQDSQKLSSTTLDARNPSSH